MGYFELVLGCPYSGKTYDLLRRINKYRLVTNNILVILPKNNNKNILETHDKMHSNINVVKVDNLEEIKNMNLEKISIILIDDLHKYPYCVNEIMYFTDILNKTVIGTILNSGPDYECYDNLNWLVPLTDKIVFLKAKLLINEKIQETSFCDNKYYPKKREEGELQLILGPMFSGKTTELIRRANFYTNIGYKVLTINHKINCRYETEKICSHDKIILHSSFSLNKLEDLEKFYLEKLQESKVIIIEETQFFKDAYVFIKKLINMNKIIVACGLDGNYKRQPFGDMCKLISLANDVVKFNAVCLISDIPQHAPFTRRIVKDEREELVGGSEEYLSCSREAYNMSDEEFMIRYERKVRK